MSEETKTCPYCAEEIKPAAIVCKHCERGLPGFEDKFDKPKFEQAEPKKPRDAAIVLIGLLIILVLFFVLRLGNFEMFATAKPTQRPTAVPTQKPTKKPTDTPCIRFDEVNQSHVGSQICFYGIVDTIRLDSPVPNGDPISSFSFVGSDKNVVFDFSSYLFFPKSGDCIYIRILDSDSVKESPFPPGYYILLKTPEYIRRYNKCDN